MLKMAFIGLGQGGGRIVDQFVSTNPEVYTGLAINTAINDLESLKHIPIGNRVALEGNAYGAGRTPDIAKSALVENAYDVGAKARHICKDTQYVWLVAGLGGGTGTGCLDFMIDYIDDIFDDIPVGIVVTLPRDDDGQIQKFNALGVLAKIHKAIVDQRVRAVLMVDNERFYSQLAGSKNHTLDWRDQSNEALVRMIDEINRITIASGESNFDRMDLLNFLSYSGCLTVGRSEIRSNDSTSVVQTVRNALTNGYFSTGYFLEEAKAFATCFTAQKGRQGLRSATTERAVLGELKSMAPNLLDTYWGYYEGDAANVLCVGAGLGFPKRVDELADQVKNAKVQTREIRAFEAPELPKASDFNNLLRKRPEPPADKPNPFKQKTAAGQMQGLADNPFRRK